MTDGVPENLDDPAWEVGHDGTVWIAVGDDGLLAFDGRTWTAHPELERVDLLEVAPDGTVWASDGWDMAAFDGQRWTRLALPQVVHDFDISPDGTVWAISDRQHLYVVTPEAMAATVTE